jgi:hypothetical protein
VTNFMGKKNSPIGWGRATYREAQIVENICSKCSMFENLTILYFAECSTYNNSKFWDSNKWRSKIWHSKLWNSNLKRSAIRSVTGSVIGEFLPFWKKRYQSYLRQVFALVNFPGKQCICKYYVNKRSHR